MWNPTNGNDQMGQVSARMETTPSLGSASISISQQQSPKKFAPVVAPKPKFNPYKQMGESGLSDPAGNNTRHKMNLHKAVIAHRRSDSIRQCKSSVAWVLAVVVLSSHTTTYLLILGSTVWHEGIHSWQALKMGKYVFFSMFKVHFKTLAGKWTGSCGLHGGENDLHVCGAHVRAHSLWT